MFIAQSKSLPLGEGGRAKRGRMRVKQEAREEESQ